MKFGTQIGADDRYVYTYTLHMPHCARGLRTLKLLYSILAKKEGVTNHLTELYSFLSICGMVSRVSLPAHTAKAIYVLHSFLCYFQYRK